MSVAIVGAAVAAVGAGYSIYKGIKADHKANQVQVPDAERKPSEVLPLAKQLFNARMPGATNAEQNIMGNQANAVESVERNASSGAQALALISAIQGQSNNAVNALGQQEGAYKLNAFNNLAGLSTNEQDKEYLAKLKAREEAINEQNALRGSAGQNIKTGINELGSTAYLLSQMNNKN